MVITSSRNEIIEKLLSDAGLLSIDEINKFFRSIEDSLEELEEDEEEIPDYLQQEIDFRDYLQTQLNDSRVYNLDYVIGGEIFNDSLCIRTNSRWRLDGSSNR